MDSKSVKKALKILIFFEGDGLLGILAYPVSIIELVGGILIFFGIGTRIFAGAFSLIMFGAMVTVNIKSGFMGDLNLHWLCLLCHYI